MSKHNGTLTQRFRLNCGCQMEVGCFFQDFKQNSVFRLKFKSWHMLMLTFAEGELRNEISTGKPFQINSTIDFLLLKRCKVFPVRTQTLFPNNDFEPPISQYSISEQQK